MAKELGQFKEVRSVSRALALVDTMGSLGWLTPSELAKETGIDRGTVYRLLASLIRAGYVVRREQDGKFFLSSKMRYLSRGILAEDTDSMLVSQALARLTSKIRWPSDYGTISGGMLKIVDSSHHLTSMTFFRNVVGRVRPILRTALGKAIVAGMDEEERKSLISEIKQSSEENKKDINKTGKLEWILSDFQRRGYALSLEETTPRICAIALPVYRLGKVAGAVNIIIFRSAFNLDTVEKEFLMPLKKCVSEIQFAFETSEYDVFDK